MEQLDKPVKLLKNLKQAVGRLKEVLKLKPTLVNQDSAIKRFEFTFELAWKVMQAILRFQGVMVYSPRNSFRSAAQNGLIDNPEKWIRFLELRNLTSHVYNEAMARGVYKEAKKFPEVVRELIERAEKEIE